MGLEDSTKEMDKNLIAISKELEYSKSNLSDTGKIELGGIYKMMEMKIELVLEQNKIIRNIYELCHNLEEEIRNKERARNKDLNRKMLHSEFIFKNLIIADLAEFDLVDILVEDDKEKIIMEENDYKIRKKKSF